MKIEVKAVTYYTVELTEEDVEKIKDKLSKDYFYKTDISDVIFELYKSGEISLYDDGKMWVRPLSLFLSEVDHEKYPNIKEKYRFTLQDIKRVR